MRSCSSVKPVNQEMRPLSVTFVFAAVILVSACDFWPRDLESLANSISQQVSGETTAWLVGGDVVVIDVAGSPLYHADPPQLERSATDLAEQTTEFSAAPLESILITFHEGGISENPKKQRQFVFLVMEGRAVLQPHFDLDASGPLTPEEIQAAVDGLDESFIGERKECVLAEVEKRARAAGDPEILDPASVDFLTAETWNDLDGFGKRLILTQAITTQALFACVGE